MTLSPSQNPETWHAPDFDTFLVAHWEEEYFLFNPRTAHTHVFNQLGMDLLQSLADRPLALEQIQRQLFGNESAMDHELEHSLHEQLTQFVVIGLAESQA